MQQEAYFNPFEKQYPPPQSLQTCAVEQEGDGDEPSRFLRLDTVPKRKRAWVEKQEWDESFLRVINGKCKGSQTNRRRE
jgi:hypothetical protein